jgi:hypothetical protein
MDLLFHPNVLSIIRIWNLVTPKAFRDQNSRPVVSPDVHEEFNFIELKTRADKVHLYSCQPFCIVCILLIALLQAL